MVADCLDIGIQHDGIDPELYFFSMSVLSVTF